MNAEKVNIKIVDGRNFEFNLADSRYQAFASLIVDGHTEWQIDFNGVTLGEGSSTPFDNSFLIQSWESINQKTLSFVGRLKDQEMLEGFVEKMKSMPNWGRFLEYSIC